MAVDIPLTTPTRDGALMPAAVPGDTVEGHRMINDGTGTLLIVENTGASPATVSFTLTQTVDGQAVTPRTETVAAGETRLFGPFPLAHYGPSLGITVSSADLDMRAINA